MSGSGHKNSAISYPNSIVDEEWEYLDPTPDIYALFVQFDDRFFGGKLKSVSIKWSPRMTVCAGLCRYEGKRSGLCSISLSVPLLKLRPRRDLVETLLHEMIHAFLFLTSNNRDRDGHGPEFQFHMNRINQESGTRITIYHSFHDEVKLYKQHWWKCNGPCQHQPPFYGLVKRSMNRAPGPNDNWWAAHQARCNGSFIKVKEPENYGVKKKKEESSSQSSKSSGPESKKPKIEAPPGTRDIRGFFATSPPSNSKSMDSTLPSQLVRPQGNNGTKSSTVKGKSIVGTSNAVKNRGSSTITIRSPADENHLDQSESSQMARPTQGGVVSRPTTSNTFIPFSGQGRVLGGEKSKVPSSSQSQLNRPKTIEIIELDDSLVQPAEEGVQSAPCPVCQTSVPLFEMNSHLDSCL